MTKKEEINKRKKTICDYLTKHPDSTAQMVHDYVLKLKHSCKLTTIKNDIKDLGFIYNDELRGYYLSESANFERDARLSQLFSASETRIVSTVNNSLHTIYLKSEKLDLLSEIQVKILEKYGDDVFGTYIANDILFLLIIGSNRCKRIQKELRKLKKEISTTEQDEQD